MSTTVHKFYWLIQLRRLTPCNFVSCYIHFGRTYCLRHQGSTYEVLVLFTELHAITSQNTVIHVQTGVAYRLPNFLWACLMSTIIGKTRLSLVTAFSDKLLISKGEQIAVKKGTSSRSANKRSY